MLWGAAGAGKSHLLRAARGAGATVRPVVAMRDAADAPSIAGRAARGARRRRRRRLAPDAVAQGRLFTLYQPACRRAAASGSPRRQSPPASLALRDDLRTRAGLGLVFEIVPLADEDKPAALAAYARERGFRLSDDVIAYLLAHGRRDMPTLVATLAALDRHSLAAQRPVTVPLLREWLQRDAGLSG